jgi:hypothetical protein
VSFFTLLLMMVVCGAQCRVKDKAYLYNIYCKVKNRIHRENLIMQSDQDVHMYGYDRYGKVDLGLEWVLDFTIYDLLGLLLHDFVLSLSPS